MARRNWLRWADSGKGPDKTSVTATASLPSRRSEKGHYWSGADHKLSRLCTPLATK
jgi:hypothetical protein